VVTVADEDAAAEEAAVTTVAETPHV